MQRKRRELRRKIEIAKVMVGKEKSGLRGKGDQVMKTEERVSKK